MKKIIAREVNPAHVDFEFYFDGDCFTTDGGENCIVYIPGDRNRYGFHDEEYKTIQEQAENVRDGFADITEERNGGGNYSVYSSFKECMQDNGISYTSRKSFYGKAIVQMEESGAETLYSYDTPIIKKLPGGALVKLWGGWSATTGRHIAAFCGLNKAAYMALPYEPTTFDRGAAYAGILYR
jgi:hypothetical protein